MQLRTPILITGASGFVGSNILRRLIHENLQKDIHVLLRKKSDTWRIDDILKNVQAHVVDMRDEVLTEKLLRGVKAKTIFHLAAHGAYPYQQKDEKEIIETNILCTSNLMKSALKYGCSSFINTGTSSEYGINLKPMTERDILRPVTAYGVSKAWATLWGAYLVFSQKAPITTLRLFGVYGFYEPKGRLIPNIILSLLNGKRPRIVDPGFKRDFVFIDDVVDAYFLAAKKRSSGLILNIGSGKPTSLKEVFLSINKFAKVDLVPVWGNQKNNIVDINRRLADIRLAKKYLGWHPKINLRDGLMKTFDWFKENESLYHSAGF